MADALVDGDARKDVETRPPTKLALQAAVVVETVERDLARVGDRLAAREALVQHAARARAIDQQPHNVRDDNAAAAAPRSAAADTYLVLSSNDEPCLPTAAMTSCSLASSSFMT